MEGIEATEDFEPLARSGFEAFCLGGVRAFPIGAELKTAEGSNPCNLRGTKNVPYKLSRAYTNLNAYAFSVASPIGLSMKPISQQYPSGSMMKPL